jgi:hypothetical protein
VNILDEGRKIAHCDAVVAHMRRDNVRGKGQQHIVSGFDVRHYSVSPVDLSQI